MKTIKNMPSRMVFGADELQTVKGVFAYYRKKKIDFGYQGYYEELYTNEFVKYMGVGGYADAVCTGTAALFVAIASLQLKPGTQVLVSAITDPGTLNAIILNQLVPKLVDNAANSYNMGIEEFQKRISSKVKAVVVVHAAGKSAPIDIISKIAQKKNIYAIEDCSQAHGAKCNGKKVGAFGDIAAFSTMYRKAHNTGGCGGVVFTQDKERYKLIRAYADRGKPILDKNADEKNPATFLFPALNLNIDEISCAIGLKSLLKLDAVIKKRLIFLSKLKDALERHSKVCRIIDLSEEDSPFFQPIWVDKPKLICSKIEFAMALQKRGISVNPDYKYVVNEWPWIHPYLADNFICKNAIEYRNSTFNLLLNERYGKKELDRIIEVILEKEARFYVGD